ncbi:MAG TPA: class I adenylate cyclase [Spirochaetota bacterium]|nr:class I adenylate cyclase [Spirochaetota bacterium]
MNPVIAKNRENFLKYNQIKFERFQQLLPNQNVRKTINLLPLLLSVNHQKVPGHVSGECAMGVCSALIDDETKRFAAGKFTGVQFSISVSDPFVQMIAVIGSIGTIAYNKKSDFDYWICVDPSQTTPEKYSNFRKKINLIQKWLESETGVSIHLFVNDVRALKKNIFDEDEDEAFGSTMGALLKDEFFRSSIITSGKVPFWWVVPVTAKNEEYDALYASLPDTEKKNDFVDIGNLYRISKEDFLGAALFQMVKSLGNPFKSILKLGVLNKYLFDNANAPLLSQKIKYLIQQGNFSNTILDSYLMMFTEVSDYYKRSGANDNLLLILKMNLYLKISPQLSKYIGVKGISNIPYRVAEMLRYAKLWQWDISFIRDLDNFDNWDFNKVMKFWDQVQRFMLMSYQKISNEFPNIDLSKKISDSDFKLLRRKIRSHYLRSEDKVEQFISFKETVSESLLSIEPVMDGIKSSGWKLFKKVVNESGSSTNVLLKTEKNLINLAAWAVLNKIYDPRYSRINVESGYQRFSKNSSVDFMNTLSDFFTEERMKIKNKFILKEMFSTLNFIVMDFGLESSDSIKTLHHIMHTSWGESFVKEYPFDIGIGTILVSIVRDGIMMKKGFEEFCSFSAPETHKKPYKDIMLLYKDSYNFIVSSPEDKPLRFVSKAGISYVLILRDGNQVEAELHPNMMRLFSAITLKPGKAASYKFYNSEESGLDSLDLAYQNAAPQTISIFYEIKSDFIFAYVVNEVGNLFIFIKPKSLEENFLAQLFIFSKNTLEKVRGLNKFTPIRSDAMNVKMITRDRLGKITFVDKTENTSNLYFGKYSKNSAYSVLINKKMGNEPFYSIKFPDGIESGLMEADQMYSVADKIQALKISGSKINNLICDIDYTGIESENQITTSTFFADKFSIEMNVDKFTKSGI